MSRLIPRHSILDRGLAPVLAVSLVLGPACTPSLTAGMRLTASTDSLGAAGTAVWKALSDRRNAVEPPFALTAIDPPDDSSRGRMTEDALSLTEITADVVIEGPLAYTQLALTFVNPEDRVREGRFSITLPTDAAIGRFAMHTADGWREAEVVSRERARVVYDAYLQRGIDPALLEQSSANTFSAKVFPIRADATTELIIGYSQEATATHPPRLALHGLREIRALTVRIHRGAAVEETSRQDVKPDDVVVALDRAAPAVASSTDFVARVAVPPTAGTDPLAGVYVLIDTSASRAGLIGAELAAMRELMHGMPDDTAVTIAAFDQRVDELFTGAAGDVPGWVDDRIVARGALGASDLGGALATAARAKPDRVVVLGDAVATAGETSAPALAAHLRGIGVDRVDVIQLGESLDAIAAAAIVGAGDHRGAVLRDEPDDDLIAKLTARTATAEPIEVDGATWSWPASTLGVAGEELVVYGRRAAGAVDRPLRITVGGRALEVTPTAAPAALVTRAVARAELAVLGTRAAQTTDPARRAELDAQIQTIGLEHRLVSARTSLLVLETDDDYANLCLNRDHLPDLIVVDTKRGLQSRTRVPPKVEAVAACAPDAAAAPGTTDDAGAGFETAAEELTANAVTSTPQVPAPDATHRSPDGHEPTQPFGSIGGVIKDATTGEPMPGATVIVSGPGMSGTLTAITDDNGAFVIDGVAVGTITLTVYYMDTEVTRTVEIRANTRASVTVAVRPEAYGEMIEISASAPAIDPTSTSQGITIDQDYITNIPIAGRTFEGALGAAAGSAGDTFGATGSSGSAQTGPDTVDGALAAAAAAAGTDAPLPAVVRDRARAARVELRGSTGEAAHGATMPGHDVESPPHAGVLADALARIDRGDAAGAVAVAARAQIEAPADVGALLALGAAAEALGARSLAVRAYGSMIDLYPGQAEIVRAAAMRIEGLGTPELDLALDAYARAAADRPDHLHGLRLWAWARARTGDLDGALAVIERALITPARHAHDAAPALAADLAILSAVIAAAEPGRRAALEHRLAALGIAPMTASSTRAFLTWETDANDVDLHVIDHVGHHAWYSDLVLPGGGRLIADVTRGYGPEVFVVGADPGPLRVAAHYYRRGPMGVGLGALQVIRYDAATSAVTIEIRPFALQRDDAVIDLGTLPGS